MAGHRYVSFTENYLVNRLEDLHSVIDKYHPMLYYENTEQKLYICYT